MTERIHVPPHDDNRHKDIISLNFRAECLNVYYLKNYHKYILSPIPLNFSHFSKTFLIIENKQISGQGQGQGQMMMHSVKRSWNCCRWNNETPLLSLLSFDGEKKYANYSFQQTIHKLLRSFNELPSKANCFCSEQKPMLLMRLHQHQPKI